MTEAYIYDAVRTPRGKGRKDGALHGVTPIELAATALRALRDRNALDTALVDDVVLGCVEPVAEQGADIARVAALYADYALTASGVTVSRFCASGLEACNQAAAQIMSGQSDLVVGGGVESMSRVPMFSSGGAWPTDPQVAAKTYFVPQGVSADLHRHQVGLLAPGLDAYAAESQRRAKQAWDEGRFSEVHRAGEGPQRPHHPRPRRIHAAGDHAGVARHAEARLRRAGRAVRLRLGDPAALPGSRARQPRAPRRQQLGHRRRRRGGALRHEGDGREALASSRAPASAPSPRPAPSPRSC
jgi:acetyl-CoA acetyltransferase